MSESHTRHCRSRMKWGDGYCECGGAPGLAWVSAECQECDADAMPSAVLCEKHAVKELRERLWEVLGSARPNPFDHPRMTWAWERARKTLERTGPELEP